MDKTCFSAPYGRLFQTRGFIEQRSPFSCGQWILSKNLFRTTNCTNPKHLKPPTHEEIIDHLSVLIVMVNYPVYAPDRDVRYRSTR